MIKYEFYPLGLASEWCNQRDRLSLYQCRLASFLCQEIQDPELEKYIRHKIDEASVDIHFLEIMAAWEVQSVTRSHAGRYVGRRRHHNGATISEVIDDVDIPRDTLQISHVG